MKYSLNVKTGLIMWIDYVEKYKQEMNTVECYSYEQCVGMLVCSELKSGAAVQ